MNKNINLKRSVFISMACLYLIACGGGNNAGNMNPDPSVIGKIYKSLSSKIKNLDERLME